ncbi:surfeit locus 1 family protein [Tistlia consotensis]|uniref:SURF1-like protein n=1 Tax=Tistlia consotensis USBA 355 TaxID=560819 RepID=A0A1Y6B6J0_9PROT|nr:SURF1 family protein [Tistlia consotensis]SME94648.1 surfeit locus 1 family protein [Tistlia consotensis USBA 355]SNR29463.1 surfeit locus 1 family protein [Tistlia consotensis]
MTASTRSGQRRPGGRPGGPWAWPIVLAALALLVGLGVWQLQRLSWKEGLIARLQERTTQAPAPLPQPLPADVAALEYRPFRVQGHYLNDKELHLASRTRDSQVGLHVVTPFRLDDGRTLLIDRGWLPPDKLDPATRQDGLLQGEATQVGLLRRGGWHGLKWFQPVNEPAKNQWLWLDLPAMAQVAGLEQPITDFYLEALPDQHPGAWPVGGQTRVTLRNDHLQYALTWFSLAVVLLIVFLVWRRKRG